MVPRHPRRGSQAVIKDDSPARGWPRHDRRRLVLRRCGRDIAQIRDKLMSGESTSATRHLQSRAPPADSAGVWLQRRQKGTIVEGDQDKGLFTLEGAQTPRLDPAAGTARSSRSSCSPRGRQLRFGPGRRRCACTEPSRYGSKKTASGSICFRSRGSRFWVAFAKAARPAAGGELLPHRRPKEGSSPVAFHQRAIHANIQKDGTSGGAAHQAARPALVGGIARSTSTRFPRQGHGRPVIDLLG
jgi:hypothetical protein